MVESIELPAESVVQAAAKTAQSKKSTLAALFWLDGIFLLSPFAVVGSAKPDKGELVMGLAFWFLILGLITLRIWRRMKTARAAEAVAKSDPTITWRLSNRQVVAIDPRGIPQTELAFKISTSMRDILLAVPTARVVQR